ncbi:hypothetical protein [Terracidiphilus gabretensis]|uniref:hypothetical protein n=1 Tax=Terracidiphilus gabretensis TaxID=1577687 RepID=UPI00071B13A0|nr:hypothetical protein [Terracidiphilus gabretensis]
MRNLTVKVPDDVYQAARLYSARNKTSIATVFAEFLGILYNADRIAPIFLREESPEFYREMLKNHPACSDRLPYVLWQSVLAVREFMRATQSSSETDGTGA